MKEFFSSFFSSANIIVRAKALIINAFTLTGRFAIFNPYTQGAALGYVLFGLSARRIEFYTPAAINDTNYIISNDDLYST